ncbi:MAG TPA: hypothetical protein DCM40_22085, partial [Maribacter sp.]|nr:hypothetical protein [Maribacter sp.]
SANEYQMAARASQSGWIISQDLRSTPADKNNFANNAISFNPDATDVARLFKFHSLSEGEWEQRNLKISIERIVAPRDNFNSYGSFSVVLRKMEDNDKAIKIVERYDNLNLNPNSPDYIAKRIGDMYEVWDDDRRRLQNYGTYDNQSKFVRVEEGNDVETGQANPELLPFGFLGPIAYGDFSIVSHDTFIGNDALLLKFKGATLSGSSIVSAGNHKTSGITNASFGAGDATGSFVQISPQMLNEDNDF